LECAEGLAPKAKGLRENNHSTRVPKREAETRFLPHQCRGPDHARDAFAWNCRRPRWNDDITLGADKAYDTTSFVTDMRRLGVTPHVAQHTKGRRWAIDRRTTCHPGYALSIRARKRIEEVFGGVKTIGGLRKTRHRGTALVGWMFTLAAAYNLVRIPKLVAAAA
jgi:hypothetical protein